MGGAMESRCGKWNGQSVKFEQMRRAYLGRANRIEFLVGLAKWHGELFTSASAFRVPSCLPLRSSSAGFFPCYLSYFGGEPWIGVSFD